MEDYAAAIGRNYVACFAAMPDDCRFGVMARLNNTHQEANIADATGDTLDPILCAIQAAWSCRNRDRGYGIPARNHPVTRAEGWIVDPLLTPGRASAASATGE